MKRTHQEVDDFLKIKESKEYIKDLLTSKKDIEIPQKFLRKSFKSIAENINKYVPNLVNTKWIPDIENEISQKKYLMKAEELRIGNLFIDKYYKQIIPVLEILRSGNIVFDFECMGVWQAEPIPLTEKWFLKCKSNSIFNNGFEYKKTSIGKFEIYAGMSLITVIEFVHELQNLNFALLGEDVVFDMES